MHQVAKLMKRWPRLSTMFSFCAAGTASSILWWNPIIFQKQSVLLFVLFVGIPGISAAIAGWILGKPLLDPARVHRPISAAIRGATIASFALLLFAPLFAIIYVWTQPATEHWSIPGLTILILMGSALTAWIQVALTGAAVGWALYYIASYDTRQTSA
jgi:hypothetical protein